MTERAKNEFNLLHLGKCKNGDVIDPKGDVIGCPKKTKVLWLRGSELGLN